jgi:CBS domain-containing protein
MINYSQDYSEKVAAIFLAKTTHPIMVSDFRKEDMMVTVQGLLKVKGNDVWAVSPDTPALDTLKMLADKDVGALLVTDKDILVGIISERDFVRSIATGNQCDLKSATSNYMTREVVIVTPEYSIEQCMQLMTQKRIRHLPVVENSKIIGVISIGDVVREIISSRESTISQLENFIEGRGFAQ